MTHRILVTLDVDWAPDFVVEDVAQRLMKAGVRATWLVTHASPALELLMGTEDLFEVGIHPNLQPDSDHGSTPTAVLDHCLELVPSATTMRTHGLVQSTDWLAHALATGRVRHDLSLFLPRMPSPSPLEHWWGGRCLLRLPTSWEDDFELEHPRPMWSIEDLLKQGPGIHVLDFHPLHVYLNSRSRESYEALKQESSQLTEATRAQVDVLVNRADVGAGTMFDEVLGWLSGAQTTTASQAIEQLTR